MAPLLSLLKKGTRGEWTREKENIPKTEENFADSIRLVHTREKLPNAINTDVRELSISSVLTQGTDSGEALVVSTEPLVPTPKERRYSTGAQESLAVVSTPSRNSGYAWLGIQSVYILTTKPFHS
jgi:hypothetical protein